MRNMLAAKAEEIATNTQSVKAKTVKSGLVSVDIVNLEEAFDDTTKAVRAGKTFLANVGSSCTTRALEWESISKIRPENLLLWQRPYDS